MSKELTTWEAAERLGVGKCMVTIWISKGKLTAHRAGGRGQWLIDPDSVEALRIARGGAVHQKPGPKGPRKAAPEGVQ